MILDQRVLTSFINVSSQENEIEWDLLSEFYELRETPWSRVPSLFVKVMNADDSMILCALTGATTDITG